MPVLSLQEGRVSYARAPTDPQLAAVECRCKASEARRSACTAAGHSHRHRSVGWIGSVAGHRKAQRLLSPPCCCRATTRQAGAISVTAFTTSLQTQTMQGRVRPTCCWTAGQSPCPSPWTLERHGTAMCTCRNGTAVLDPKGRMCNTSSSQGALVGSEASCLHYHMYPAPAYPRT